MRGPADYASAVRPEAVSPTCHIRVQAGHGPIVPSPQPHHKSFAESGAASPLDRRLADGIVGQHKFAESFLEEGLLRLDEVAEPRSWIKAYVSKRAAGSSTGGSRAGAPSGHGQATAGASAVRPQNKPRPLATPEFLGISAPRAYLIRELNRQGEEENERRFGHLRRR